MMPPSSQDRTVSRSTAVRFSAPRRTEDLEAGLWMRLLHAAGGVDIFEDALVAQKPRDHQEDGGRVLLRVGRGRKSVEIDAGSRQKTGLVFRHHAAGHERAPCRLHSGRR